MAIVQFWYGRAADLQEQAAEPIQADVEMAMPHSLAIDVISSLPGYVELFNKIYGSTEINLDRITDAIAVFEETLVTANSRLNQWLRGDDKAITEQELAGHQQYHARARSLPLTER